MSLKSLWFVSDPQALEEETGENNAEQQDQNSSASQLSSGDSINSEHSLEPKRLSFPETLTFKIPKIRKESQAYKLVQYFREMNGEVKKGKKKYLSGYFLDKEHTGLKKSQSIDNFDKERMQRTVREQENDASFSSTEQKTERTPGRVSPTNKPRDSFLMARFRRKSCHCSDCGGASKFELKVQNVIGQHNKQLKANILIRRKLHDKMAKYAAPFLNLPKANAVVVSTNKGRSKNSKQKTVNSMKIAPSIMQNLLALKDKIPRRGAETPLKMSRNTDENKFFNTKEQYSIKIFSPAETDKQVIDAQKGESTAKKDSDVAGINLKDFMKGKKAKPKLKHQDSSSHPNSPRVIDVSLPRVEELKREDSKSATLVKKISTKFSDQSLSEFPPVKEVADEMYMNNPIKKERWGPIVTLSPKFKSTLIPQIEDEMKQIAERTGKGQGETKGMKTYHVKKAYSGNLKLLPRIKSQTEKSDLFQNKIILPTQEISRCATEAHDGKTITNRTVQTAGFYKEVFPNIEGENQFPVGVSSARLAYDFENSPYFKKAISRKSPRFVFGSHEILKSANGNTQRRESMSTGYSLSKKSQDEKTSKFIPKLVINTTRSSSEYQLPSPTGSFRPSSTTSSFYRKGSMPSMNGVNGGGRKVVNVSVEKNKKKQTM